MSWFVRFLTSSIGYKLVMSLTGLFLITFLTVHLAGNLQLLLDDGGKAFDLYAYKMTHNPFIKTTSYGLYFFILLHAVQGLIIASKNRSARGTNYKVTTGKNTTFAARKMALLGTVVLLFIIGHMAQFWYRMKFGELPTAMIDGLEVKGLYEVVNAAFQDPIIVVLYLVSLIALGFHLSHGFQSAFQTLGFNHPKYTPVIKAVGIFYSVVVTLGFAIIPIWMFVKSVM